MISFCQVVFFGLRPKMEFVFHLLVSSYLIIDQDTRTLIPDLNQQIFLHVLWLCNE